MSYTEFVYLHDLRRVYPDLDEILPAGLDSCGFLCKNQHINTDIDLPDGGTIKLRLLCKGSKAVRLWADFRSRHALPLSASLTPAEAAETITGQWAWAATRIERLAAEAVETKKQREVEAATARIYAEQKRMALDRAKNKVRNVAQEAHAKAAEEAWIAGDHNEEGMKLAEERDGFAVYRVYEGRPGAVWFAVQKYLKDFDPLGYGTTVTWDSSGRARVRRWASCE